MGIKGLMKLISDNAPKAVKERQMESYFARKVAVDGSLLLYQFLIQIRSGPAGEVLTNENGDVTSHLQGMFHRTIALLDKGIKPVFVFDGKPPQLKGGEFEKRTERRAEAEAEGELKQPEDEEINKYKKHNAEARQLLTLMGVPIVEAPSEAEAQCSAMVKGGLVYGVATEDMDALTFGTPRLLRHLTLQASRNEPIVEIDLACVLREMNLTMDQFIDLCILCGCDYTTTIRGIGPMTALKLIQTHGNIQEALKHLDKSKYKIPDDFLPAEAAELFRHPEVTPASELKLEWKDPDEEGIINFLVTEKGFNLERVQGALKRLKGARQKASQQRIEGFFKMAPPTAAGVVSTQQQTDTDPPGSTINRTTTVQSSSTTSSIPSLGSIPKTGPATIGPATIAMFPISVSGTNLGIAPPSTVTQHFKSGWSAENRVAQPIKTIPFNHTNSLSGTMTTAGPSPAMTSGGMGTSLGAASTNPTTVESEPVISAETTFRPHGILKLPQSIASTLASDFLRKREIRDWGVTCRWMLVSLNQCVINEPVSLQFAIDRLNHTKSAGGLPPSVSYRTRAAEATLKQFVTRIPDFLIGGRFRSIQFTSEIKISGDAHQLQIKLFSELFRLRDAHTLSLSASHQAWGLDQQLVKPIQLPPNLDQLILYDVTGIPPLCDFALPPSLKRVHFLKYTKARSQYLSKVRWPSGLTELLNARDKEPLKGLLLPDGLRTLTFPMQANGVITTGFTLPNSITNLEIHRWEDGQGRYRDLPFPQQLKRLVFSADIQKDDLDLTTWHHLPITCENLQLHFIRIYDPHFDWSKPIVIPSFIQQLRIHRLADRSTKQISPLHLTDSSSLVSLVTNSLESIKWPTNSKLIRLKALVQVHDFLNKAPTLPATIEELDFSHYCSWECDMKGRDRQRFEQLLPTALKRVFAPWDTSDTLSVVLARLNDLSISLPKCFIETHSDNGNKLDWYQEKGGSPLTHLHLTNSSEIDQWKQRHRAKFDQIPILIGDE